MMEKKNGKVLKWVAGGVAGLVCAVGILYVTDPNLYQKFGMILDFFL